MDHGWLALGHIDKRECTCENDGEHGVDQSQDRDWTKSRRVRKHLVNQSIKEEWDTC